MIFGNMQNFLEYTFLEVQIQKCFVYAAEHDLQNMAIGRYEIEGNDLFVNVTEYGTASVEERYWEAHKKYIDLHLMLDGQEKIDIAFTQNMELKEYVEEKDFLPLEGKRNCSVILNPGDFLICFPKDGHRTGIAVENVKDIKKAIFKIKVSDQNIKL